MPLEIGDVSVVTVLLLGDSFDPAPVEMLDMPLPIGETGRNEVVLHDYLLVLKSALLCLYVDVVHFPLLPAGSLGPDSGFSRHLKFSFDFFVDIVSDVTFSEDSLCRISHQRKLLSLEDTLALLDAIVEGGELFFSVDAALQLDVVLQLCQLPLYLPIVVDL